MKPFLFYLSFSTLLAHELDAMTQAEWRLLFLLCRLPEPIARDGFILLHIPLVAALIWLFHHSSRRIQQRSRIALSVFLVIHAWLHWHLRSHPLNTFSSPLSVSLIYGAGVLGGLSVVAAFKPLMDVLHKHRT